MNIDIERLEAEDEAFTALHKANIRLVELIRARIRGAQVHEELHQALRKQRAATERMREIQHHEL